MSIFSEVRGVKPRMRKHNLSFTNLISCDMGQIVPCYVQEVVPGSKLNLSAAAIHRFMALLSPMYHNVNAYVHFWYMPYRLLDSKFADFISGFYDRSVDAAHPITDFYNPPYFTYADLNDALTDESRTSSIQQVIYNGSLLDFLGYAVPDWSKPLKDVDPSLMEDHISVRRIQMYLHLIKLWYSNENIKAGFESVLDAIDDFIDPDLSGNVSEDLADLLLLLKSLNVNMTWPHAWQKDYFTSALPYVQLGAPVALPISGNADVSIPEQIVRLGNGSSVDMRGPLGVGFDGAISQDDSIYNTGSSSQEYPYMTNLDTHRLDGDDDLPYPRMVSISGSLNAVNQESGELQEIKGTATLTEVVPITINELRIANALQVLKERMARFGTRVREYYLGFFGVILSDKSLQQPQWLRGGKLPINISEVEQTSATANSAVEGSTTPQGNLAGKGFGGSGNFAGFKAKFEEEGIVMGLLFIQPQNIYANQGLNRFLTKLTDRFDFFNPTLQHLGEQAIKASELYYAGDGHDNDTFGYTSRYAEYKFHPNEVHGQFVDTLNFWHLARIFGERPTLSPEFIYTQNEEVRRVFAVQSIVQSGVTIDISSCLVWLHFTVNYIAPLSKFGTPMLLN